MLLIGNCNEREKFMQIFSKRLRTSIAYTIRSFLKYFSIRKRLPFLEYPVHSS